MTYEMKLEADREFGHEEGEGRLEYGREIAPL